MAPIVKKCRAQMKKISIRISKDKGADKSSVGKWVERRKLEKVRTWGLLGRGTQEIVRGGEYRGK